MHDDELGITDLLRSRASWPAVFWSKADTGSMVAVWIPRNSCFTAPPLPATIPDRSQRAFTSPTTRHPPGARGHMPPGAAVPCPGPSRPGPTRPI